MAEETRRMEYDSIAEELDTLATAEPPVVSDLLRQILDNNLPIDLGSPLRQLVDVIRDVRNIVTKATPSTVGSQEAA